MWLRDFLPKPRGLHPELSRLRVMTYGYSSLLRDNKNITGLEEWSSGLIQSVAAARRSPSVNWTPPPKTRPLKKERKEEQDGGNRLVNWFKPLVQKETDVGDRI